MIRFECDYAEGAHPQILERLLKTNFEQTRGYGNDDHCDNARRIIRRLCGCESADVHFMVGGTQANLTVIASALRPHQGVIAAATGHINVHETGAIEATGHKVLTVPETGGKLTAAQVEAVFREHRDDPSREHAVQPAMVYISHPTECGTLYTKEELSGLSDLCRANDLLLFMDGARLGYGLVAENGDLALPDIARLCDVFYIGGTKVGAMFGEAVVITNDSLKRDFRYHQKQRGGMLAKGRLLGIQYEVLFEDGLYFDISRHAVRMAMKIRDAFRARNISFLYESSTNQQFPILTDERTRFLKRGYAFEHWRKIDEKHGAVRLCTSWATREEDVDGLVDDILTGMP